jgi:hypothetical protein
MTKTDFLTKSVRRTFKRVGVKEEKLRNENIHKVSCQPGKWSPKCAQLTLGGAEWSL